MRIIAAALFVACIAGCSPDGYYVADVYQDAAGHLTVKKCAISNGYPDPTSCHVEAVERPPVGALVP